MVFSLSCVVNGLTAGLLMGAVVVAVGKHNRGFVSLACLNIVIATNAGGSFSPLGGISALSWQYCSSVSVQQQKKCLYKRAEQETLFSWSQFLNCSDNKTCLNGLIPIVTYTPKFGVDSPFGNC